MIFSEQHRFIYFANSKTGSTSIERALSPYGVGDRYCFSAKNLFNKKHIPPAYVKAVMPKKLWDECFKFIFVRNPYDWFVSQWFHNFQLRSSKETTAFRKLFDKYNHIFRMMRKNYNGETFYSLVNRDKFSVDDVKLLYDYLAGRYKTLPTYDGKFQSSYYLDQDGQPLINFVGHFERLDDDIHYILKKLNLEINISHLNSTNHKNYRDLFTSDSADMVYRLWRIDFDTFGYSKHLH